MLDKIYSLSSLENQLLNQHHNFIIVLDNDIPVGFASFSPKEENRARHFYEKMALQFLRKLRSLLERAIYE
ncbi:hypothetical protein FW778_09735 [Ginsengibacter hankyongi]|uniref:Uncharacterized protein n=1 Tax=Ginsengibacter hankyongi TaxID=2607284 RepID=A0A5J5IJD2_9BACT|nr:hypothetical protein [Ginsengibacter hankyongi]KAA9039109.1 hypothetical protein FW778_09735 [Ginsengibacter hankyongi]